MNIPEFNEIIEPNDQTEARREYLDAIRAIVGNAYPNRFERSKITGAEDTISNVLHCAAIAAIVKELKDNTPVGEKPNQELKESLNARLKELGDARVSGRLTTTPRTMGKAAFVHLSDGVNRLQIYVRRDDVKGVASDAAIAEVNGWELFKLLDGGDFVGVSGFLFLTNTGELSVHVETIQFLSKALLPMPDKMHGIADPELQRRYRYADLIASSLQIEHDGLTTREVFERRARLISGMRRFLDDADFTEVETPILTTKATGAAAEPFETYHNALDIKLYARIAPELYLKRLMVGGFERVYELNRNFRNEGLSHKHSPEFTMLEFYVAYMDVNGMMDFAEAMIKESVKRAAGSLLVRYGNQEIDFSKFERLTMKEAIHRDLSFNIEAQQYQIEQGEDPQDYFATFSDLVGERYDISWLDEPQRLRTLAVMSEMESKNRDASKGNGKTVARLVQTTKEERREYLKQAKSKFSQVWREATAEAQKAFDASANQTEQAARDLVYIFEESVEETLIQPTFITDYPKSISPLSKASPDNPNVAERFELFINGMECANGFSELNDPREQYERFRDQMTERETGDAEAMILDEDYIKALAYGMPPAAGIGIGIDRFVMLLTDKHSIRDVILFPHMRPVSKEDAEMPSEEDAGTRESA